MEEQFDVFAFAGQSNADGHFFRRDGDDSVPLGREVFQQEIFDQTGFQTQVLNVSGPGSASNNNVVTPFTNDTNFWWNLDTNSPGPLLIDAIANIRAGLAPGQDLDGLVWSQGEEDADAIFFGANANATINDLVESTTAIFETFRAEFGDDLPIFIQELGDFPETTQGTANGFDLVRQAQLEIAESDANIYIAADADAPGVEILDDGIHISTEGLGVLAEQLADTVVDVISQDAGVETTGTTGDDVLSGTAGDDVLIGGRGSDVITGRAGDDVISTDAANGANRNDQDVVELGNITPGSVGNDTITDFDTDNFSGGENNFDTLSLTLGGRDFTLSTGEDIVDFVDLLQSDNSASTGALQDSNDIVLVFNSNEDGDITDSVRLEDVIDDDGITQARLNAANIDQLTNADNFVDFVEVTPTIPTTPVTPTTPTNPTDGGEQLTDISAINFTQSGTQNADALVGTNGNDAINGGLGDDDIGAGAGDDILHGGGGQDFLFGDAGSDTFIFAAGSGFDTIADFEAGSDQIDISNYGFTSFDQLNLVDLGNSVALFINETASVELLGVNNVSDLSADDFIFANAGTTPETPVDPVTPPTEGEVAPGTGGDDVIIGSDGDDIIRAAQGDDLIDGGAGNDNIRAGAGEDNVAGGTGDDFINGRGGNDFLAGDAGADIFFFEQNSGFDTIADFGNGNDRIDVSEFGITSFDELNLVDQGSSVSVFLDANTSAELLGVSNVNELSASDFIFADAADDGIIPVDIQLPFAPTTPPVDDTVNLVATDGNDVLTGTDAADTIFALQGNDSIDGGAGNDVLNGNGGNDDIAGGIGSDIINGGNDNDNIAGGNGADTINGGSGNDFLVGDAGADTFVFTEGSGFDTIVDFGNGNDRIDLSAFDFDDFGDLNIVEQNNSVFIFIDENTSIELSNTDADELSADDFVL